MRFAILFAVSSLAATFVFNGAPAFSQVAQEERAKAYYFEAEAALGDGRLNEAERYHDEAVNLLGASNAKLAALHVRILFAAQRYEEAKAAIQRFYSYDPGPNLKRDIAPIIVQIDDAIVAQREARIAGARQLIERARASYDNDPLSAYNSFSEYVEKYPGGVDIAEARSGKVSLSSAASAEEARLEAKDRIASGLRRINQRANFTSREYGKKKNWWKVKSTVSVNFDYDTCTLSSNLRVDTYWRYKQKYDFRRTHHRTFEGGSVEIRPNSEIRVWNFPTSLNTNNDYNLGPGVQVRAQGAPVNGKINHFYHATQWSDYKSGPRTAKWGVALAGYSPDQIFDDGHLKETFEAIATYCKANLSFYTRD